MLLSSLSHALHIPPRYRATVPGAISIFTSLGLVILPHFPLHGCRAFSVTLVVLLRISREPPDCRLSALRPP